MKCKSLLEDLNSPVRSVRALVGKQACLNSSPSCFDDFKLLFWTLSPSVGLQIDSLQRNFRKKKSAERAANDFCEDDGLP